MPPMPPPIPFATTSSPGDPLAKIPDQLVALFIQDSWRVRPNLTINAGLRYDWQGQHVVRNDKNNFGPRLSFTYDPDERGDVHHPRRRRAPSTTATAASSRCSSSRRKRSFVRTQIVNPGYPDPFGPNPNGTREGIAAGPEPDGGGSQQGRHR